VTNEAPKGGQTILVVEDEGAIADNIVYALKTEGFEPRWVSTGTEALAVLGTEPVAALILDVGLPDVSGFELCKQIRRDSAIPILFLTARAEEIDRVVGLEIGGDDYMVKPFSPRELTARIKAILRRTTQVPVIGPACVSPAEDEERPAPLRIEDATKTVVCRGTPLVLSPCEFRLLEVLLRQPGRVYSRSELMERAWDEPGFATERTVDTHIKSIRTKIREVAPELDPIETRRGFGYALKARL
jgi:two-component system catabolic regulation response regulator CreB